MMRPLAARTAFPPTPTAAADGDRDSERERDQCPPFVPPWPIAPVGGVVHHQGEGRGQRREHQNDNGCPPKAHERSHYGGPFEPHKARTGPQRRPRRDARHAQP